MSASIKMSLKLVDIFTPHRSPLVVFTRFAFFNAFRCGDIRHTHFTICKSFRKID